MNLRWCNSTINFHAFQGSGKDILFCIDYTHPCVLLSVIEFYSLTSNRRLRIKVDED